MTDTSPSIEFFALQRCVAGRYSLVRELGRGGMGIVFLARDVALDRYVAIKLLPPVLAADATRRERFLREARLAAGLSHPNIVPVHLVESRDELVFFVMAFVDGETLGQRVRRSGPLPVRDALRLLQEVTWALAHAHARGVVHRDVKPDNILIERDGGRAVVTDFGIADGHGEAVRGDAGIVGTPHYLAPEQAEGKAGDARADLYALGVTAWFALTGRVPIDAPTLPALLQRKVREGAPALGGAGRPLPVRLTSAIDGCLARNPSDRWPDAETLARALGRAASDVPLQPRVVRDWVRLTMPIGAEGATGVVAVASAFAVMKLLIGDGNLFNALFADIVMVPIMAVILGYLVIRSGQVAMATRDVVRAGFTYAHLSAAITEAMDEMRRDAETEERTDRVREAWKVGLLGGAKSVAAYAITASSLPDWVTIPAAAFAAFLPALTWQQVRQTLRPGPNRWHRWLQRSLGPFMTGLARWVSVRQRTPVLPPTPTVVALGDEVRQLYAQLPAAARLRLTGVPEAADRLRADAEGLRTTAAGRGDEERLATVAAALEALRLELFGLKAGARTVEDVTRHLDAAWQVGRRVDEALGDGPVSTESGEVAPLHTTPE